MRHDNSFFFPILAAYLREQDCAKFLVTQFLYFCYHLNVFPQHRSANRPNFFAGKFNFSLKLNSV